jgi:hypothetical protein
MTRKGKSHNQNDKFYRSLNYEPIISLMYQKRCAGSTLSSIYTNLGIHWQCAGAPASPKMGHPGHQLQVGRYAVFDCASLIREAFEACGVNKAESVISLHLCVKFHLDIFHQCVVTSQFYECYTFWIHLSFQQRGS